MIFFNNSIQLLLLQQTIVFTNTFWMSSQLEKIGITQMSRCVSISSILVTLVEVVHLLISVDSLYLTNLWDIVGSPGMANDKRVSVLILPFWKGMLIEFTNGLHTFFYLR